MDAEVNDANARKRARKKNGEGHYCRARIIPQSSMVGGQVASPELARNLLLAWQGHLLAWNRLPADAEQRGLAPALYVHRGRQSWGENYHVRRESLRRPLPRHHQLKT